MSPTAPRKSEPARHTPLPAVLHAFSAAVRHATPAEPLERSRFWTKTPQSLEDVFDRSRPGHAIEGQSCLAACLAHWPQPLPTGNQPLLYQHTRHMPRDTPLVLRQAHAREGGLYGERLRRHWATVLYALRQYSVSDRAARLLRPLRVRGITFPTALHAAAFVDLEPLMALLGLAGTAGWEALTRVSPTSPYTVFHVLYWTGNPHAVLRLRDTQRPAAHAARHPSMDSLLHQPDLDGYSPAHWACFAPPLRRVLRHACLNEHASQQLERLQNILQDDTRLAPRHIIDLLHKFETLRYTLVAHALQKHGEAVTAYWLPFWSSGLLPSVHHLQPLLEQHHPPRRHFGIAQLVRSLHQRERVLLSRQPGLHTLRRVVRSWTQRRQPPAQSPPPSPPRTAVTVHARLPTLEALSPALRKEAEVEEPLLDEAPWPST